MRVPTRRKPLVYPGELNPKTPVWSVWAWRPGFCWLQSSWRIYPHRKAVGRWARSSPFHDGHLPPTVAHRELHPHLLPTSGAVWSSAAGNSSCCSVMLKAEKYNVKIFMHKGKGLILKERKITQNNWSLTCRKHGSYWFRSAERGNGRQLLQSRCWHFLLSDLAEQIKKAKAISVFCCYPNDPKCSEEIATKHFTQSICGIGLKNYW